MGEKTSFSEEPTETAMATAFGTSKPMFEWFQEPGNELRQKRFGAAMRVSVALGGRDVAVNGMNIFISSRWVTVLMVCHGRL
jgi:hypothetical protein